MKAEAFLCAITGFFFGLITYLLLLFLKIEYAFVYGFLGGIVFYLLLFPYLCIHKKRMEKRYTEFEKELGSPVFCKINGNFDLCGGKIKNGNIYFCDDGIVCVSLDEKPYLRDDILVQDIEKYQFDNVHLNIVTKDGRIFVITSPDVQKAITALRDKDRIKL